jgi:hypothetical protein
MNLLNPTVIRLLNTRNEQTDDKDGMDEYRSKIFSKSKINIVSEVEIKLILFSLPCQSEPVEGLTQPICIVFTG